MGIAKTKGEIVTNLVSYLDYLKVMGVDSLPSTTGVKSLMGGGTIQTLEEISEELGDCRRCKLWERRNNIVFGQGNPDAILMFVGEGPGRDEDIQGLPFVGRAGQLLTKVIEAINLRRQDVYIANIIKCRPPENREPEPDEVTACLPFLIKQIKAIRPRIICTLGAVATNNLLGTKGSLSKTRGEFRLLNLAGGIMVMPTFHTAYLLRNPAKKKETWEDMKKVRDLYAKILEEEGRE